MRHTQLLLLTDFYPFEVREPFIKNEMPFLVQAFQNVHILCTHAEHQESIYPLPPNVRARFTSNALSRFEKVLSIRWLFSAIFWEEFFFVKNSYSISRTLRIIKIMILTLETATKHKQHLQKYIAENRLDKDSLVIYSYWTDSRAIAAAWLKKSASAIAISRAHGWDVYFERQQPAYLPFRKFIHDNLSSVFFVSENGRDYSLNKVKGSTPDKFKVSRLGTLFRKRNPDEATDKMVIITNGGFIPLKRVYLVPGILAQIKNISVHWMHFGFGPMQTEVERYAAFRLQDHPNITFKFMGHLENEELLEFYSNHHIDLLLHTSEFEGMPVVIMEAFSFGIPVIATNVGGIGEAVNEDTGFLLDKNFKPEKAAALIESYFHCTDSEKKKKRDNAFKKWQEYFNAGNNYPTFVNEVFSLGNKH